MAHCAPLSSLCTSRPFSFGVHRSLPFLSMLLWDINLWGGFSWVGLWPVCRLTPGLVYHSTTASRGDALQGRTRLLRGGGEQMQEAWGGQVLRQGQQVKQIHLEWWGRESGGPGPFPGLASLLSSFPLSPWRHQSTCIEAVIGSPLKNTGGPDRSGPLTLSLISSCDWEDIPFPSENKPTSSLDSFFLNNKVNNALVNISWVASTVKSVYSALEFHLQPGENQSMWMFITITFCPLLSRTPPNLSY